MRRESDTNDGERTGGGRRARDRLMTGDTPPLPERMSPDARARAANRMLLLADELRESALAAAGIEAYLVELQRLLDGDADPQELVAFAENGDIEQRLADLDDAVSQLRRSLQCIGGASTLDASNA